jgi:hypothetical protein
MALMIDRERIAEEYDQAHEDNRDLADREMVKIIAERVKPDPEQSLDDFMRQERALVREIERYVYDRERVPEIEDRERE